MNIHFIKGQYIWQKKFFNVIRISFRWQKTVILFFKKSKLFHHKFNKKTWALHVKVLKKYGAKRGFLRIKAKSHFCLNYLQQFGIREADQESFLILKSGLSQSNFYKKIVKFHHFKKRIIGPRSIRVSDVQSSPNFLFRIHNILNGQGPIGPKAYEYLIKYHWVSPKGRPKFYNQAKIFGLPHRSEGRRPTQTQSLLGGSLPNMSLIIWKTCFGRSPKQKHFHKLGFSQIMINNQSNAFESYSLAKKAAIFPASSLGENHHNFLSVFDKKTKGPTTYYLQTSASPSSYQNIWFQDYEKSNQNTYFLQRPISFPFQWIQKGDLLSDCSSSLKGELALGKNLFVAYMPWEGFNFEDAVLINEKVLSKYTSLHIEKYDLEIAESGLEKITAKVPGISTKNLQKLDPNGVVKIGSWVTEGDILVGRILPIPTETQNLLTHEKLLYDIVVFGQKETQIQERCLRVPQGVSGRIIRISYTYRIKHQENWTSHPQKNYPSKEILKNPSGELFGWLDPKPIDKNLEAPRLGSLKKELSVHRRPQGAPRLFWVVGSAPRIRAKPQFKIPFFKAKPQLYCYLVGFEGRRPTWTLPSYDLGCPSNGEQKKKKGFRQKTLGEAAAKVPQMMKTVILQKKASVFLRWFRRYESFFQTYFWVIRTNIFGKGEWIPKMDSVRVLRAEGAPRDLDRVAKDPFIKYNNKIFCWNWFIKNDRYQKGLKPAKAQFLLIRTVNLFLLRQNTYKKNWAPEGGPNFLNIHKRNFRTVGVLSQPLRGNRPLLISPWGFPKSFKKNQNQFRKQSQIKLFKTKKRNLKNIWRSHDSSSNKAKAPFKPLVDRWADRTSASSQRSPDNGLKPNLSYKNKKFALGALAHRGLARSVPTVFAARPRPCGDLAEANAPFINSLKKITLYIAEKREFQIGDKISGRHGNKGIISQIFANSDMPYLANGCTLDVLLNPLGVPSRMNVGQIFECLLGFTGKIFHTKFQVLCFDEIYGYESSRSFIYSKLLELCKKTRQKWLLSKKTPGKFHLFDGRNGQLFDQSIMVGSTYLMKLIHVVDEKIHARGTGPYSLITQQPLRGRAKHGGQRLGEMEVWALQGFGSAYTLQELLTVKSDDLHGRNQVMQTLLKNTPLRFGTPESLRVVLRELQCLCLDLQLLEASHKR